jgi:hypothetical protein
MRLALAMFHQFCDAKTVREVGRAVLAWQGRRPEELGSKEWHHEVALGAAASGGDSSSNIAANMRACGMIRGGAGQKRVPGLPKSCGLSLNEAERTALAASGIPEWFAACVRVSMNATDEELDQRANAQEETKEA